MPKIVKTITNEGPVDSKAWILNSEYSEYFTQSEIDNILTPYTAFMTSLAGNIGYTIEEVDGTLIVKHEFDTVDNMQAALNVTTGPDIDIIVKNRNDLFINKLAELGSRYSSQITFEY